MIDRKNIRLEKVRVKAWPFYLGGALICLAILLYINVSIFMYSNKKSKIEILTREDDISLCYTLDGVPIRDKEDYQLMIDCKFSK